MLLWVFSVLIYKRPIELQSALHLACCMGLHAVSFCQFVILPTQLSYPVSVISSSTHAHPIDTLHHDVIFATLQVCHVLNVCINMQTSVLDAGPSSTYCASLRQAVIDLRMSSFCDSHHEHAMHTEY